jgi:hypothetical protein
VVTPARVPQQRIPVSGWPSGMAGTPVPAIVPGRSGAPVPPGWSPDGRPLPKPQRRTGLKLALSGLIVAAVLLAICDGGLYVMRNPNVDPASTTFMGTLSDQNADIKALLDRRAKAVTAHDQDQFMADVDQSNGTLVSHEHDEYANLTALAPATFTYSLDQPTRYLRHSLSIDMQQKYTVLRVVGVTVKYSITGVDTEPVAEPWIPIFGYSSGRWMLAGELRDSDDNSLPLGAGGLPWEGLPITVVRGAHVVVVVSTEDKDIAQHVVNLSETGITRVDRVRPTGWAGKVLVTASSDESLFNAYFAGSEERIQQVAAMAVPRYQTVPEWSRSGYTASRVLFNPTEIGRGDSVLQHTLTHEFTHAAMGPLTTDNTPLWLARGMPYQLIELHQ